MAFLAFAITALAAYLLGSLPTGYLAARARGIDIRSVGSGNIGATNVFRVLGLTAGILVLAVDALKGFLACWLAARLASQWVGAPAGREAEWQEYFAIVGGCGAILGHVYTCWLKFKGGKGVATTAGVLLGLLPLALVITLSVWLVVLTLSRYVSLASIVAALCLPFAAWGVGRSGSMIGVAAVIGVLVIYKHKNNIRRLLAGAENRFGVKKPADTKGPPA